MSLLGRLGLVSAGVGLLLAAQVARAQGGCTFTDENGKTVFWPDCQPPNEAKSAPAKGSAAPAPGTAAPATNPAPGSSPAKNFPFPGETPAVAPGAPNAANAAAGQKAAGSSGAAGTAGAADKFPFPGEDSSGSPNAAKGAGGGSQPESSSSGPLQDAGSSGSSSSSGENDSAAGPLGDTDPAAKAAEARRAARKKKGIDFHQTQDQREAEDLKIAAYYQNDGDYKGAYERATDAVSLAADDADAQLALADAARRLGKLDEAETHYRKCLTLDPVPKTKKAAEKALREMTAGGM